jgi:gliding motility-associated-like protein
LTKPAPNLGLDRGLCLGDSLTLSPGEFDSYLWWDGSTRSNVTIRDQGLYSVEVTNSCGSARDEVIITEKTCDIYFPSAFTPNNDGKNDLFRILGGNNLTDFRLVVYDRWGQKVFESFDSAKGWNGSFGGRQQSSGTFVWYCEFKEPNKSGKTKLKGTVTLVR